MGQALTRIVTRGSRGDIEATSENTEVLSYVIDFVIKFPTKHVSESRVLFVSPLQWKTTLDQGDFLVSGSPYGRHEDGSTVSKSRGEDDLPVLVYAPDGTLNVRCMEELASVLVLAGDNKLQEIKSCLNANPDPLRVIFGERLSAKNNVGAKQVEMAIKNATDKKSGQVNVLDEDLDLRAQIDGMTKQRLRMYIHMSNVDVLLMNQRNINEDQVNCDKLSRWMDEISQVCGPNRDNHVLHSINYTSKYTGSNGLRAPLWRQLYGDICYLVAKPHDGKTMYVCVNIVGFWRMRGLEDYDFEPDESAIYPDLYSLLLNESPRFARNILKYDLLNMPKYIRAMAEEAAILEKSSGSGGSSAHSDSAVATNQDSAKLAKKAASNVGGGVMEKKQGKGMKKRRKKKRERRASRDIDEFRALDLRTANIDSRAYATKSPTKNTQGRRQGASSSGEYDSESDTTSPEDWSSSHRTLQRLKGGAAACCQCGDCPCNNRAAMIQHPEKTPSGYVIKATYSKTTNRKVKRKSPKAGRKKPMPNRSEHVPRNRIAPNLNSNQTMQSNSHSTTPSYSSTLTVSPQSSKSHGSPLSSKRARRKNKRASPPNPQHVVYTNPQFQQQQDPAVGRYDSDLSNKVPPREQFGNYQIPGGTHPDPHVRIGMRLSPEPPASGGDRNNYDPNCCLNAKCECGVPTLYRGVGGGGNPGRNNARSSPQSRPASPLRGGGVGTGPSTGGAGPQENAGKCPAGSCGDKFKVNFAFRIRKDGVEVVLPDDKKTLSSDMKEVQRYAVEI